MPENIYEVYFLMPCTFGWLSIALKSKQFTY